MNVRPLSAQLQAKAQEEINEVPSQLEENLAYIKDWLRKQQHLKYKEDDQLLLNFLRCSKFSLERTKQKIDCYYSIRTLAPEFAHNLDPYLPAVQEFLKNGMGMPLEISKDDITGPRIIFINTDVYDPDVVTSLILVKCFCLIANILLNEDDNFIVSGTKIVWDMKGIKLRTALQITPVLLKKLELYLEKAYPTRIKAIYLINMPKFFIHILNAFRLLLSKKLKSRFHVYSSDNWQDIYKDIPKSIFPNEYGGEGGKFAEISENWKKRVESHRERLLDEDNYCSDETKRPDNAFKSLNLYGLDGSFKKLDID